MESNFIEIKGLKIHYLVEGRGSPALFLHGHRSDAQRWRNLIIKLGENHQVFAPDLPGFGLSEELPQAHYLDNYLPYLFEFIEKLKLKNFILVGASMGAVIATSLAKEIHNKIRQLVLLGPIYDRTSFKIPKLKLIIYLLLLSVFPHRPFFNLINKTIKSDRFFKPFLKLNFPKEARSPQILDYEVKQWRVMSIKVWAQTLFSLLTFNQKNQKKFNIPVILIFPEKDQYLNIPKTINSFKDNFPEVETFYIKDLIHIPKGEMTLSFFSRFNFILDKLK